MRFHAPVARLLRYATVCGVLSFLVSPAIAFAATPEEIQLAIEKARGFLYSKQQPGGQWEKEDKRRGVEHDNGGMQGDTFGGYTAIATYALLASGESRSDPRLTKAIQFLEDADVIGIYSLGLRANVWALLGGDRRARVMAERDAQLIISGMQTGNENARAKGFWDYGNGRGPHPPSSRFDHSISQYGVLGLWACEQDDVPIDRHIWETIDAGWKSHQFREGCWDYINIPPSGSTGTVSMTAAGVATLFITEDMLYGNRGLDCKGNQFSDNIERGLAWITDHFKEVDNTYAWYGIERIGAASGRKYFGAIDWYAVGAEKLLRSQNPDGSWKGGFPGGDSAVVTTSFALLFLSRGREPLMMNKLQYELAVPQSAQPIEGDWSQRPRDVSNLVHWTARQMERPLSWQIVNLKGPVEDLHNAPILYISGDQELVFLEEDEAKLREFVESGGMILANADCGGGKSAFAASFEALGHRLFPRYAFRDLPANHPIFTDQPYFATRWKTLPRVRALSNGVREMMVLIPDADPARAWQIRTDASELQSFQLGADIFLYAVDKQNLSNKGENYYIRPDGNIIADRTVRVARLAVGANYDPEPGGWRRLAAMIHNQYQLDVDTSIIKLGEHKLTGFKLAHLTGTEKFILDPPARQALTDFVHHGGTLIIDAAGGNPDFADAAVQELKLCFGSDAMEGLNAPLDLSNPVYHLRGATIRQITYRDKYRRQIVGKSKSPRINGIKIGNRIAVYFSREDLTAGMVGEPVGGIAGYSPQCATEIMRNIVLYAGFGFPVAAGN